MKHPLDLMLRPALAILARPDPPTRADAIAVLGATVRADGTPGRALAERIDCAADLYRRGLAPLLVLSGGRRWGASVEAEVMHRQLLALGVDSGALLLDVLSQTTRENAEQAARLLAPRGARSVLVVTQPLHLRRAVAAFAATGLTPYGVLIEHSYQLEGGDRWPVLRDLGRELAAYAAFGARRASRAPWLSAR